MQAVAISATLHQTITVCSVYIPPNEEPKELELNNSIEQLPRPFVMMGTLIAIMKSGEVRKPTKRAE